MAALIPGFSGVNAQMMHNCRMQDSTRSSCMMHQDMMRGNMMGRGRMEMMCDSSMMGNSMMMNDTNMMRGMRPGMMQMMMNDSGMMGGMGPGMMKDMSTIHFLLVNHDKIERQVKNIKNGVETWTESNDAEIAKVIREHAWEMKKRIEECRPIRQMDPLFRELFNHHDKIKIQIEETGKGTHVIETSNDPEVVKLIRQHAKTVSEFVERGMQRAMQPTPLP